MNHQKFDALTIEYDFVSEIFNNNDFFCPTYQLGDNAHWMLDVVVVY
jgi:hypothetical protein